MSAWLWRIYDQKLEMHFSRRDRFDHFGEHSSIKDSLKTLSLRRRVKRWVYKANVTYRFCQAKMGLS